MPKPNCMRDLFSLESYSYEVPEELIAKFPLERREEARLLLIDRKTGRIDEARVSDLPQILSRRDLLIFNDTKVLHALIVGRLPSGKGLSCLLCQQIDQLTWSVMAKGASRLSCGSLIVFKEKIVGEVVGSMVDGLFLMRFSSLLTPALLERIGSIPLPPYMKRKAVEGIDALRYQTIYAKNYGAVAAPTAGLHFSELLLQELKKNEIERLNVTLHVGAGTFVPIRTEDIRLHKMHSEIYEVGDEVAQKLNSQPRCNRIAVGTTALRALETKSLPDGNIVSGEGSTNLYIQPGYKFKAIDFLFTNFHTPKSTLLVLISSFMGYELMQEAYAKAIEKKFRLFSYGDAMLIR